MNATERAQERFGEHYGREPEGVFTAPGRVNLIGDHTDYTGGLVLPAALKLETALAYRVTGGAEVQAVSESMGEEARFGIGQRGVKGWAAYLAGVAWALAEEGFRLPGLDLAVASDVPSSSGLSSSAALEVAAARVWREVGSLDLDDQKLAQLCQRAENLYVGVPSGIMDQFSASVPQPGQAILLDCRSLAYEVLAVPPQWSFVVVDSGASRQLAASAYAQRVEECETVREMLGLPALRDLRLEDLERLQGDLRKRARHVFYENKRVEEAAAALARDDIKSFGTLMTDSHRSLKEDYEVSSEALDRLVEAALAFEGTYGSRLTGAGFGGCTVSLIGAGDEEAFGDHLRKVRPEATLITTL